MPEAMQAKGLAWDDPAVRTVEVLAFCSWSMCLSRKTHNNCRLQAWKLH